MRTFKLLNLKLLNFKLIVIIGLAVALLAVYFVFFYNPIQDIPSEFENIGFKVEPLVFEGRRIHFPYTDENNGESIIIKSDKKVYVGGDRSDVYFTVTNTGDKSEKIAILKYFPKEYGNLSYVDVWSPRGRTSSTSDSEWQRLPLTRGDIKGNMTKLGEAFKKKKPVPEEFDVKAGIQFEISAGHTAYFKAEITYPFNKEGEFWFEAFGDQGGYGLLDPLFVGGGTTVGQTTTSKDTTPGWYSGSWSYRKKITIDKKKVSGTSDLSSFPVLISRTDPDFKHTSFGGNVASSSAGATGGGGDFVFTSSDGTTKIDHEIEKYASSSGEIIAWVEVPTLSVSADTVLYVYYGGPSSGATNQNKTGTWDSNYIGVWHLPNGTTLTGLDSTSNGENWTVTGATASSKIGGSANFDGTDDTLSQTITIPITGTLSMWWKPNENFLTVPSFIWRTHTASPLKLFDLVPYYANDNWYLGWYNDGNDDRTQIAISGINVGTWYYVTSIWTNGGATGLYIDAVSKGSGGVLNATWDTSAVTSYIAFDNGGEGYAAIGSDEVRISDIARSSDWIKTEYNNQFKPSTFYGFGGQQKITSSTTKIGQTTTSRDTPPGWYQASGGTWDYRRKITVDKSKVSGTSNLSNFPMLVALTYSDLKTTAFSGKAASGSGEFVFTSSDGTTVLPHEIETYSSSSGQFIGWVNVTTLSVTQDTSIYMYYGGPSAGAATNQNKTGTWDSNYIGVWHLNEIATDEGTVSSLYKDSTSNNNNGNQAGPNNIAGKIAQAQNFDSGIDSIDLNDINAVDTATQLTGCVWVKHTTITNDDALFVKVDAALDGVQFYRDDTGAVSGRTDEYTIVLTDSADTDNARIEGATNSSVQDIWTYVCFTAVLGNSSGLRLYVNGIQDTNSPVSLTAVGAIDADTFDLRIGTDSGGSAIPINGSIDEARISNTARSAAWIKTEYNNQSKPSTFYTIGGLEKRF